MEVSRPVRAKQIAKEEKEIRILFFDEMAQAIEHFVHFIDEHLIMPEEAPLTHMIILARRQLILDGCHFACQIDGKMEVGGNQYLQAMTFLYVAF